MRNNSKNTYSKKGEQFKNIHHPYNYKKIENISQKKIMHTSDILEFQRNINASYNNSILSKNNQNTLNYNITKNTSSNIINDNNNKNDENSKKLTIKKNLRKEIIKEYFPIKPIKKSFISLNIKNSFSLQKNKKEKSINKTMTLNQNNSRNYFNKNKININFLTHKNSFSELQKDYICPNSYNSNTTSNTNANTNSNNKSNNSQKKNIKNQYKKNKEEDEKEKKEEETKIILENFNKTLTISTTDDIKYSKEYINDILLNLLEEEKKSELIIDTNYFSFQNEINKKMRGILIDWLIEVHYKYNFKPSTLYITIYIIDKYLCLKKIERKKFQLLGVCALSLASKQNEILLHRMKEYIYITDYAYNENEINEMEFDILKTLDFNLLFPTVLDFYEILAKQQNFEKNSKMFYFGEFLFESFFLNSNYLKYTSSTIACAVGYIVMKFFKMENYQECYSNIKINMKPLKLENQQIEKNLNYSVFAIKECAKDICQCLFELSKNNLKSTVNKYSSNNYEKVSKLMFKNAV